MSIAFIAVVISLLGVGLFAASRRNNLPTPTIITIDRIEELLPQTQCGQCGHMGCRPYAEAIAQGEAINRCPPGGNRTIHALANLLHTKPLPPDFDIPPPRSVASFAKTNASAAPNAFRPAPLTPSSAPRN